METTTKIKLNSNQLEIIKNWKEETLNQKFRILTKISDLTFKSYIKLTYEKKYDALIQFIQKQSSAQFANISKILKPEIGTIKNFKDGDYQFIEKKEGEFGWKKII